MNSKPFLNKIILLAICFALFIITIEPLAAQEKNTVFKPGQMWADNEGKPIEAHGGGILKVKNIYYWYGENHALGEGNKTGISCYSSSDLLNWKNEGVVFAKNLLPTMYQDTGACERPKVIYNEKTKKYVMWMHLASNRHREAEAGVAIASSPTGPFKFIARFRPIVYNYGYKGGSGRTWGNNPDEEEKGNTYRDMTLFKDDNNDAYAVYASEDNATMYVAKLNESYTDIVRPYIEGKTWSRILIGGFREAPALFKHDGKYFIITSGTTGWKPNPAEYAMASHVFGPYILQGDPCIGDEKETTFQSQPTFVLPAPGNCKDCFIYLGDRWNGRQLEKSTYVWLPFKMINNKIELRFLKEWNFKEFKK